MISVTGNEEQHQRADADPRKQTEQQRHPRHHQQQAGPDDGQLGRWHAV